MNPKISLITLGVNDLPRAVRFYRDGLGLPLHAASNDDVAFFSLNGTWLGLWSRKSLAEDAGLVDDGKGFRPFTLAHNTHTKAEVDEVLRQAERAGAKILKQGQDAFWGGYYGHFADPEGFVWEVARNPHLPLA